jgi:hypothetical protein
MGNKRHQTRTNKTNSTTKKTVGQSRIGNLDTLATWETKDIRRGQTKQNSTTKKTVGAIKN